MAKMDAARQFGHGGWAGSGNSARFTDQRVPPSTYFFVIKGSIIPLKINLRLWKSFNLPYFFLWMDMKLQLQHQIVDLNICESRNSNENAARLYMIWMPHCMIFVWNFIPQLTALKSWMVIFQYVNIVNIIQNIFRRSSTSVLHL